MIWSCQIRPEKALLICMAAQHPHLPTALLSYEEALRARVDACRTVTGFTKIIAAFPEAAGLMQLVPQPINGFAFDMFLNHSLSGGGSYRGPISLERYASTSA